MSNKTKYDKVFMDALRVKEGELPGLAYQSIQTWDSVGHMNMIEAIEDTFDIMMDTEDIVALSSYEKGMQILAKYGVNFE